jgi:hypothetical protein
MNNTPLAKIINKQIQAHQERKYKEAQERKQYDITTGIELNSLGSEVLKPLINRVRELI